jgi:uncharacterized membrane protein HdeD (DUF308 family)
MEKAQMSATSVAAIEDVRKNWAWLFGLGLIYDLLGVLGLVFTLAFTLAGVTLFGALLLVGAVAQIGQAVKCRDWRGSLLSLLQAALYASGGILILADPMMAAGFLTVALALAMIAIGVLRIGVALKHKQIPGGATMLGLSGAVAVVVGIFILVNWPVSGMFAIGLFISIELMMHGQGLLVLGAMARRAGEGAQAG